MNASPTTREPLIIRSSFSVEESVSSYANLQSKIDKKRRRKLKRKLFFRHHRGHWAEMIRGTFPIFVAATLNSVVQQILDIVVGSGGIHLQLLVNFLYACFVAHVLGYIIAYYVPEDNVACEYYASLASDNASFAWSSFLTLVIMNWVYSEYPVYAAVFAWIVLVLLVMLFLYGTNYLQAKLWTYQPSIRRRLRDFESDCFALAIAYSFTVIIAASIYQDSATDYVSNTDDLDEHILHHDDGSSDKHHSLSWIFFVYTACATIALFAYQWQLNKFIQRKSAQRQAQSLLQQSATATSPSPLSTTHSASQSPQSEKKYEFITTKSPPLQIKSNSSFLNHSSDSSGRKNTTTVNPVYNIVSTDEENVDADEDVDEDEDETQQINDDASESMSIISEMSAPSDNVYVVEGEDSRRYLFGVKGSLRRRCYRKCFPWDQDRHAVLAYRRCWYTTLAYTVACAWHLWCQLSFVTFFDRILYGNILAYLLFAIIVSICIAMILTVVTVQKEWAGVRSLPVDSLFSWFVSASSPGRDLHTDHHGNPWLEMESILYIMFGRLTVGWAWNTVFSETIAKIMLPNRIITNRQERVGLLLVSRLILGIIVFYIGYQVETWWAKKQKQRRNLGKNSNLFVNVTQNSERYVENGNDMSSGMRLFAGDDVLPDRQHSTNMRL